MLKPRHMRKVAKLLNFYSGGVAKRGALHKNLDRILFQRGGSYHRL